MDLQSPRPTANQASTDSGVTCCDLKDTHAAALAHYFPCLSISSKATQLFIREQEPSIRAGIFRCH